MPAQMTQGGGLCRADGLVDPSGIPGVTMDPAMIRTAAWTLAAGGEGIAQHGDTASSKWQTLSAVYHAPESDALLAVMTPVAQKTTQVGHGFTTVATALNAFATAVDPIVAELKRLQTEAIAFVADAVQGYDLPAVGPQPVQHLTDYGMDSGPPEEMYSSPAKHVDWTGYPPYAMHNEKLITAIAAQATALDQAQADCVNAIRAAAHPSAPPEQVRGEDFTAEAAAGDHLPFGTTARGQHKGECFHNFLWGGLDATVANIQGMASLANFDLDKGRFYDWAHWGGTLAGTAEALGVLAVPTPLAWTYANDPSGMVPQDVRAYAQSVLDKQQQTVDGFLGSDEQWKTDPAGAWGALAANVAPMLIPVGGEAAAGAKVAATGAKVAAVGTRLGEAADAASVAGRVAGAGARASVVVGSGMVRVGDLLTTTMTNVDAVNRAATGAAVQALRETIDRIPTVEVVVTHAVTPDGFRIPVHAHVEFGSRNHTHAMTNAADNEFHGREAANHGEAHDNNSAHTDAADRHSVQHLGDDHAVGSSGGAAHPEDSVLHHSNSATQASAVDIPKWITRVLEDPNTQEWRRRVTEGIKFNYENHGRYPHNEVTLANGYRVDSYIPGREIVSRKHTQIAEVLSRSAMAEIKEITRKYAPGSLIKTPIRPRPDTVFSEANRVLGGLRLRGQPILEVPPQVHPIPDVVLEYADAHRVIIRDTTGHVYNKGIPRLKEVEP
ncbi:hypothetical protein BFL36_05265 [Clavibacter michiganensis]|uniref:Uncharacterized protein n=1 Tax=Clavibacter michiganensis TaxID=28447 RepID=A0A251YLQ3_9MICO|nr:hypothetical protein [Clavibacter michiganensis]OUE25172.1 hypothetical protein BFL36_05265 [Clavibacter michiganensis]